MFSFAFLRLSFFSRALDCEKFTLLLKFEEKGAIEVVDTESSSYFVPTLSAFWCQDYSCF